MICNTSVDAKSGHGADGLVDVHPFLCLLQIPLLFLDEQRLRNVGSEGVLLALIAQSHRVGLLARNESRSQHHFQP